MGRARLETSRNLGGDRPVRRRNSGGIHRGDILSGVDADGIDPKDWGIWRDIHNNVIICAESFSGADRVAEGSNIFSGFSDGGIEAQGKIGIAIDNISCSVQRMGCMASSSAMKKILALVLIFMLYVSSAEAEGIIELRIPCEIGSSVVVKMPSGEAITLGRVLMVPARTNHPAYTASKWSEPSTVCATAVNAVHLLVNVEDGRGRIISLVPSVTVAPAATEGAYFSLDMPAGTGIFGGYAPLTGSKVSILHEGKEFPLTDTPQNGDTLIIRTVLPENPAVYMVDIENRPGGRVIACTQKGLQVVARVVRRIAGVGRFGGTVYQGVGRIRASHSGVIDVSTSRREEVGGLQIMPLKHALTSHEMLNAWSLTQWMIIAPLPGAPDLEGKSPLFKSALVPGPQLDDRLPDMWSQYGRKPLVLCRRDGGNWEYLPEVSGKVDDGLRDVTHLRIYFPVWREPL